jgi:16S rRNA (cytosine967-C5)-methyltransferase
LNVPDWLWERWLGHYGEERARAIAAQHLGTPPLDLMLTSASDPYADVDGAISLAPQRVRLRDAGKVEQLPGFTAGRWWVQDFAASLPASLLGDVAGKIVIDLCAAPGGKTLQLANAGARVTSVDSSPDRLGLVEDNLARMNLEATIVAADARDFKPPAPAPFVLLDAPCTGTGTIRRHPDLPWIKSAADIAICESLQRELLDAAAEMTAREGALVYAVCSLEPEEGVEQINAFLRRRTDFKRVPLAPGDVFDGAFLSPEGDLRTLPCHWAEAGGMDGFYAARLKRTS